jgi:hypothetical protein
VVNEGGLQELASAQHGEGQTATKALKRLYGDKIKFSRGVGDIQELPDQLTMVTESYHEFSIDRVGIYDSS